MSDPRPFVTPAYMQTMARYNAVMNERIYAAAARLPDDVRRADKGAFWKSIHGTLNHLLWADTLWMSRFDGWAKPPVMQKDSPSMIAAFDDLSRERGAADARISGWAGRVSDGWLSGNLTWVSGSAGRELSMPASFLVAHFFNHQTHHRGQVHALITATGEVTGDTDLFLVL